MYKDKLDEVFDLVYMVACFVFPLVLFFVF